MGEPAGTGNTAPALTSITILLLLWTCITYSLRIWVKLRKSDAWGADDVTISIAAFALLMQMIAIFYSIHRGYGNPWQSLAPSDQSAISKVCSFVMRDDTATDEQQSLFASQILYVCSMGFTKISCCFFIGNILTRDARNVRVAQASVALCAAWIVGATVAIAVRGDISHPYDTRNGTWLLLVRWVGIEISGYLLDTLGAALATYFVWPLRMTITRKLLVLSIFNCRLILAIPITLRLIYLQPSMFADHRTVADIITEAIMAAAIILASITCLKPFLLPFDPVAFGTSATRTGLFRYTAETPSKRSARYYELSGPGSGSGSRPARDRKNEVVENVNSRSGGSGNRDTQEDELPLTSPSGVKLRPDEVTHNALATSVKSQPVAIGKVGGKSISQTKSWTVSVGDI